MVKPKDFRAKNKSEGQALEISSGYPTKNPVYSPSLKVSSAIPSTKEPLISTFSMVTP